MDKKSKKYCEDIILCVFLIAAAVLFYIYVIPSQIRIVQGAQNEVFSPDTFPRLLTLVFIVCAVLHVLSSIFQLFRTIRKEEQCEKSKISFGWHGLYAQLIPYIIFGIALLYVIGFQHFGFVWATIMIPPVVLLVLRCYKWYFYVITYAFAALMYALFRLVLQVPLH